VNQLVNEEEGYPSHPRSSQSALDLLAFRGLIGSDRGLLDLHQELNIGLGALHLLKQQLQRLL
jgi:hypothetical protein